MIQDIYRSEPWKMIVCTILLNQTSGVQVKKMMRRFFKKFNSLQSIRDASEDQIVSEIRELGMQNVKAKRIKMFCSSFSDSVDLMRDNIVGFLGVGDYTQESIDVFIKRDNNIDAKDKEIRAYLDRSYDFKALYYQTNKFIDENGSLQPIKRYAPKEVLNYLYEYDSNMFCDVIDDRLKYVIDKLDTYKKSLEDVNNRLFFHRSNRQAVIQFDQSGILPNCTVSIQFQIRENILYLSVFQRSQDIEKMEMDCEIFNRMALEVIKKQDDVDDYRVKVFVGNVHKFIHNIK